MTDLATETPKNKGGRPKGLGKVPGSGRQMGVPNRTRAQTLERIEKEADPIGFLILVSRGLQFEAATEAGATKKKKMYPSHDQRLDAAKVLARKVLPDTKAVEVALPDVEKPESTTSAEFDRWVTGLIPEKGKTESPPSRPNGLPDQDTPNAPGRSEPIDPVDALGRIAPHDDPGRAGRPGNQTPSTGEAETGE